MYHGFTETDEAIKARWELMQKRAEKIGKQNDKKTGGLAPSHKSLFVSGSTKPSFWLMLSMKQSGLGAM